MEIVARKYKNNTMQNKAQKIIILMILMLMVFSVATVNAQVQDYTVLAPLPGIGDAGGPTKLQDYIPAAFRLAIGIGAGLAFVMITFGGIVYATSDAIQGKSDGRKYIENALWGLLLVLGAYAILWTINPNMLSFNLSITPVPVASSPASVVSPPSLVAGCATDSSLCVRVGGILQGYPLSGNEIALDNAVEAQLNGAFPGVTVNNPPCVSGGISGCTNVVALPQNAISGLISLNAVCRCAVVVTGGTEGGHATHGPGLPRVDLAPDPNLSAYLSRTNPAAANPVSGTEVRVGGAIYKYENTGDNGRATAPHWHVSF